jgi:hypothetical protein
VRVLSPSLVEVSPAFLLLCNGLLPYCVVVNIYGSLATCRPFQPGFVSLYRCVLSRGRYGTLSGSIPNLPESKAFWVVPPYIQAFRLVTGFVISILQSHIRLPSLHSASRLFNSARSRLTWFAFSLFLCSSSTRFLITSGAAGARFRILTVFKPTSSTISVATSISCSLSELSELVSLTERYASLPVFFELIYPICPENYLRTYFMGITIQPDQSRGALPEWVRPLQGQVGVSGFANTSPLASSTDFVHLSNIPPYITSNALPALAQVATTGVYDDLLNKPNLSIYATSNSLAQVATTGVYDDLLNKPNLSIYATSNSLAQVATTGVYDDLLSKPNLQVYALSNALSQVATTGSYLSLSNTPNLQIYALSNSIQQSDWAEGNVSNLSYILNKPDNLSQFSNDTGFVVQNSSPTFQNLTVSSNLSVANGYLRTNVSPLFNGSFWSISDNPIEKPTPGSEALKIGQYVFDGASILFDAGSALHDMWQDGVMADALAT